MEEVSGQDLDWFFDAWLHQSFYTDYALKQWSKKPLGNGNYEVTATILNKGDMLFPLDVEVLLSNGEKFPPGTVIAIIYSVKPCLPWRQIYIAA